MSTPSSIPLRKQPQPSSGNRLLRPKVQQEVQIQPTQQTTTTTTTTTSEPRKKTHDNDISTRRLARPQSIPVINQNTTTNIHRKMEGNEVKRATENMPSERNHTTDTTNIDPKTTPQLIIPHYSRDVLDLIVTPSTHLLKPIYVDDVVNGKTSENNDKKSEKSEKSEKSQKNGKNVNNTSKSGDNDTAQDTAIPHDRTFQFDFVKNRDDLLQTVALLDGFENRDTRDGLLNQFGLENVSENTQNVIKNEQKHIFGSCIDESNANLANSSPEKNNNTVNDVKNAPTGVEEPTFQNLYFKLYSYQQIKNQINTLGTNQHWGDEKATGGNDQIQNDPNTKRIKNNQNDVNDKVDKVENGIHNNNGSTNNNTSSTNSSHHALYTANQLMNYYSTPFFQDFYQSTVKNTIAIVEKKDGGEEEGDDAEDQKDQKDKKEKKREKDKSGKDKKVFSYHPITKEVLPPHEPSGSYVPPSSANIRGLYSFRNILTHRLDPNLSSKRRERDIAEIKRMPKSSLSTKKALKSSPLPNQTTKVNEKMVNFDINKMNGRRVRNNTRSTTNTNGKNSPELYCTDDNDTDIDTNLDISITRSISRNGAVPITTAAQFRKYKPSDKENEEAVRMKVLYQRYTLLFSIILVILFIFVSLFLWMASFSIMCLVSKYGMGSGDGSGGVENSLSFACFKNSTVTTVFLVILGLFPVSMCLFIGIWNTVYYFMRCFGLRQPLSDFHF